MCLNRTLPALAALGLLILALPIFGQSPTGAVNGTVFDPSNAVIPGVAVTLKNEQTGIESTALTTASGYYTFSAVKPGTYTLRGEMPGFKTLTAAAFDVDVNQTVTRNMNLSVGDVAETVEVLAEAPLLQSSTSELGTVIGEKAVERLPLNGRNFTQLLLLTPGVTPVNTAQEWGATAVLPGSVWVKPAVNGQWNRSNLYLMDGVVNSENLTNGYSVLPSLDAVQEFKVQSHNDKGEYGMVMGGNVNLVTKSGSNELHGSLFEFLRNEAFNARNPFTDLTPGEGPASFRQNQFGGTVGGPVYIPHLYDGHNRTFFFVSYDGWRYRLAQSSRYRVPLDAELGGDFSGWEERIFDPQTTVESPDDPELMIREPFLDNRIPANRLSPMMVNSLRKFYDRPNIDLGFDNVLNNRPAQNDANGWQFRIDHQIGQRATLFARYNDFRVDNLEPETLQNGSSGERKRQQLAVGWNQVFSPTMTLSTRAALTTAPWILSPEHPFSIDELTQLGWLTASRWGQVSLGVEELGPSAIGGDPNSITYQDQVQLSQDFSWWKGNHELKFGWLGFRQAWGGSNPFQAPFFGPDPTSDPSQASEDPTGLGLASAMLGLVTEFEGLDERFAHRWYTWSFYGQDQWKVRPNLTLTLSLRYEFDQPTKYFQPRPSSFDLDSGNFLLGYTQLPQPCSVTAAAPCIPGEGTLESIPAGEHIRLADRPNIRIPDHNNFAPRLGVAWQFSPKTVLRAGAGIAYDVFAGVNQQSNNIQGRWPGIAGFFRELNLLGEPATSIEQLVGERIEPLPDDTPWLDTVVNFKPNKRTPYSVQYHVEFQRQFMEGMTASLGYVGSFNRRMDLSYAINTALAPGPGSADDVNLRRPFPYMPFSANGYGTDFGRGHYNSLQFNLNRRFSGGAMFLVSYTWSKTIDNGSSGWFGSENGPAGATAVQNVFDFRSNQSVAAYDVPHNLWFSGTWELPFGKGKRWLQHGAASEILGNWRFDFIQSARSGQAWNPRVTGDLANVGRSETYLRPNLVGDPDPGTRTTERWINTDAFAIPRFSYGNLGRNTLRSEAVFSSDLALAKDFLITETARLEFRAEAFNIFNVMNYGVPQTTVGRSNFGSITGLAANQYPRQFQFGLRLAF